MVLLGEERVSPVQQVTIPQGLRVYCVGSGSRQYQEQLQSYTGCRLMPESSYDFPRAAVLADLAINAYKRNEVVSADQLEPIYLRNQVVQRRSAS